MDPASTSSGVPEPWNSLLSRIRGWVLQGLFAVGVGFSYVLFLQSISINVAPPGDALSYSYFPLSDTKEHCAAAGGTWIESVPFPPAPPGLPTPPTPHEEGMSFSGLGTCQGPLTIDREREAQTERWNLAQFLTFTIGGGIALLSGVALLRVTRVAPALVVAGVLALRAIGSPTPGVTAVSLGSFGGRAHLTAAAVVFALLLLVGDFLFRRRRS